MRKPTFAAALLLALASTGHTLAAGEKPLQLVVTFPPGTTVSIVAGLIAEPLGKALGREVGVKHIAGRNGVFGAWDVARDNSQDDSVLLLGTAGPLSMAFAQKNAPPYAPGDFAPVAGAGNQCAGIIVSSSLPVQTLKEFVAYAKAHEVVFGSGGFFSNMLGVEFARAAGVHFRTLYFNNPTAVLTQIATGSVSATLTTTGAASKLAAGGKVRILAVLGRRCSSLEDIPSLGEQGVVMPEVALWVGLLAPKDASEGFRTRAAQALKNILARPDIAETLRQRAGFDPHWSGPVEFGDFLRVQITLWRGVLAQ